MSTPQKTNKNRKNNGDQFNTPTSSRAHEGHKGHLAQETHDAPDALDTQDLRQRRQGQRLEPEERQQAQQVFLETFEVTGNVRAACKKAGIDRSLVYYWQEHDETFTLRFHQAEKEVEDVLEAEALRRAVHGVQKPLTSMGKLVTDKDGNPITVTEYSDTLLVKMLAARHRLYGDKTRRVEVSGVDGAPIQTQGKQTFALDLQSLNPEQLAALAAILEQAAQEE